MARCDSDDTCYRVFCVTLLAIALTFTLILTDVFMDIDGLIRANEKEKEQQKTSTGLPEFEPINDVNIQIPSSDHNDYPMINNNKPEPMYGDIKNIDEERTNERTNNEEIEDTPYRTKRSLATDTGISGDLWRQVVGIGGDINLIPESVKTNPSRMDYSLLVLIKAVSYQSHIRNPNIITKRLAALFDQSDDRSDGSNNIDSMYGSNENESNDDDSNESEDNNNIEVNIETNKVEDDLLHLVMHNILLQGMLGHMDLNELYNKINTVIDNYDAKNDADGERKGMESLYLKKSKGESRRSYIQNKFYEELMHCKVLQRQIADHTKQKIGERTTATKQPKMIIKTVIDIQPLRKEAAPENKTSANDIESLINLILAGRSAKYNEIDEKHETSKYEHHNDNFAENSIDSIENNEIPVTESVTDQNYKNAFITDAIAAYLSLHPNLLSAGTKRLKRNVKVRKHPTTTHKPKLKKSRKLGDDELYVEIETHFDGNGLKGEKKRKLVKSIIDKIQKAIHNNLESLPVNDKKGKHFKIRRRDQNPLESIRDNVLINKFIVPIDHFMRRNSAPLSKTQTAGNSPYVGDSVGDTWRRANTGPHFLSASKAINSAELGQINVNYEKIPDIPERMQVPLNADESEDNFYELGNMKFYIKELDGTGFSIGFNQYLGEPPDEDSMKSFTGIDNLIKTYQSKYEDDVNNNRFEKNNNNINLQRINKQRNDEIDELKKLQRIAELPDSDEGHDLQKREIKRLKVIPFHRIFRRSTENNDYHSNEYKIIFNNNFLPYDTYQDIFTDKRKKNKKKLLWEHTKHLNSSDEELARLFSNTIGEQNLPFVIDNDIINKNLKPSEIFGLANLLGRRKRSMTVKKFSKINMSKMRFINTNLKTPKRIFMKSNNKQSRRAKRQIDNIRIVTADGVHNMPLHRHSDENVLVVSNEDFFPNNRYSQPSEMIDFPENFEQPEKPDETYSYANPMVLDPPRQSPYSNVFGGLSRHNALMSKYPHIFMEEISRSKEEEVPNNPYYNEYNPENQQQKIERTDEYDFGTASTEGSPQSMFDIPTVPKVQEIVDAIIPKSNYKLTVKIMPRNMSFNGFPAGFKEIHTSINKSISKNGMLISSLLNVSEISRVEKLNNKTDDETEQATISPLVKLIKNQQEKMKYLLRQHKKKIDEQLDHLNKEKMNLETIIVDKHEKKPSATASEHIEVMLPSNPPQLLHLTNDEAGQLISSALMKLKDIPRKEEKVTTAPPAKPIGRATTMTQKSSMDQEKNRIINTIQHNENLTNKILNKIDRNTELLQRFLQKFSDRIEGPNLKRNDEYNTNIIRNNPEKMSNGNQNNGPPNGFNNHANGFPNNANVNGFSNNVNNNGNVNGFPNNVLNNGKLPMTYQTHWKDRIHDPFLRQTMPNLEVMKNDTHVSIPFVYAYQQPYQSNKPNTPVASVVYQGHIHTNAIRGPYIEPKIPYQEPKIPYQQQKLPYQEPALPKSPMGNQTKFFIDGDVNDFGKLGKDEYGAGLGANITNIT